MAFRHYSDFVLIAEDVQVDSRGTVLGFKVRVFDSPAGQGEQEVSVTIPEEFHKQLRWLEQRKLDTNPDAQMDLGEMLASLLLPDYVRQLLRESLKHLREDEGLRLRLRLADELSHFPWEYMYIQDNRGERTSGGWLALDSKISIARHEAIAIPGDWFQAPGKRRVVVAMATPEPYTTYRKLKSLPAEQKALRAAMEKVAGIEPVFVPIYADEEDGAIAGVTIKELMKALMLRTDVFHFSGHGDFIEKMGHALGSRVGEGGIVLADERNQAEMLPADRLAEVLKGRGIRLVVLGACETGRRDGQNVWSSVVASLLKTGIPAVVAMQFTINDKLAAAFSGAFYNALVAGLEIDEAVALGRLAIRAEATGEFADVRDWGVPVLYLRAAGGKVFHRVSDDDAVKEATETLGHLVEQNVREVSPEGRMIGAAIETLNGATVEVKQRVIEKASGVVIGARAFHLEGGRLVVRQQADVVDGTLIGMTIGEAGNLTAQEDEIDALFELRQLLKIEPVHENLCPTCAEPNNRNASVCASCGSWLPRVEAFDLSSTAKDELDEV